MLVPLGPLLAVSCFLVSAQAKPVKRSQDSLLVVLQSPATSELDVPSCLRSGYYGSFGSVAAHQDHTFVTSEECVQEGLVSSLLEGVTSGSVSLLSGGKDIDDLFVLVWVGEAGVQSQMEIAGTDRMEGVWDTIMLNAISTEAVRAAEMQAVFAAFQPSSHRLEVVQKTQTSLFVKVPYTLLSVFDTFLPSHIVAVTFPSSPLTLNADSESKSLYPEVPKHLLANLQNITDNLSFDAKLDKIVGEAINEQVLVKSIKWLTGEASDLESRHSFAPGSRTAAAWIKEFVINTGAECTLEPFFPGFAPNVICTYPSLIANNSELVILSAHYDSRGSFGKTRAPGGDDDGSGTGHLLAIAEGIARLGIDFKKTLILAFFAGEEQGLVGSGAYAKQLQEQNATVLMQIQADMLGYHDPTEPLQMGLPASIGTKEVFDLVSKLAGLYSPELVVGTTEACCSDHQRFVERGFPATQVFERNGPIIDPMYHNSGDLSMRKGYDFDQIKSIGKVTLAAAMSVAGWEVRE